MKRLLIGLLTALGLAGLSQSVKAEGTGTRFNAGAYNVYSSSDVSLSTTGVNVAPGSRLLHKVIISSPSYNADTSTNAVISFYNNVSGSDNLRFDVPYSTIAATGLREFTFDIEMSSGIFAKIANATYNDSKITAIFTNNRSVNGYKVWSSTYMGADTSVHQISSGPVVLHKVIVLTKGTGTSILTLYDTSGTASPLAANRFAAIDLTDTAREYTFNVLLSSGITVQASGAGTVNPKFIILYKRNPSGDYELWRSTFTTGTATTVTVADGQNYMFGGVVNGDSVAASSLTIFDNVAAGTKTIAKVDGAVSFDRKMYDVSVSSGISISSAGNGLYTILYKRR